jgi:hypothetical protein
VTAPILEERRPSPARLAGFVALLLGVAWGLGAFAAFPWQASPPDAALLKVAIKRVADFEEAARPLSAEELAALPRHMRPVSGASVPTGRRRDTRLSVVLDGRPVLDRTYRPGGWRHDGPTLAYAELPLSPGRHRLEAILRDAGEAGAAARLDAELDVQPWHVLRLELSPDGAITVR